MGDEDAVGLAVADLAAEVSDAVETAAATLAAVSGAVRDAGRRDKVARRTRITKANRARRVKGTTAALRRRI